MTGLILRRRRLAKKSRGRSYADAASARNERCPRNAKPDGAQTSCVWLRKRCHFAKKRCYCNATLLFQMRAGFCNATLSSLSGRGVPSRGHRQDLFSAVSVLRRDPVAIDHRRCQPYVNTAILVTGGVHLTSTPPNSSNSVSALRRHQSFFQSSPEVTKSSPPEVLGRVPEGVYATERRFYYFRQGRVTEHCSM